MESLARQRFVSFALAAVAALMISSSAWAQERVLARVTASALYLRTGPGSGYRILGWIPSGTDVEVKSQTGTWSLIAHATGEAWVQTAYLAPLTAPRPGTVSLGTNLGGSNVGLTASAGGLTANVGGLQLRVAFSTPAPSPSPSPSPAPAPAPQGAGTPSSTITTPAAGATQTGSTQLGPIAPAEITPAANTPSTSTITPSATTPNTSTLNGSAANGLRSTGSTGAAQTPAPTMQTGTAPSAPASNTPLPTSSAYAPTGAVPAGQSGGYIQLRASGAGHYGYGSAARKYGRPALIYGLERISAQFASTGHKMGVGDISQNGGGRISGHASHTLGVDVDVRPCRKDKAQLPVTWQQTAVYDRAATQTLGNLFGKELKLTLFFYNDPQVNVRTKRNWPNHDNHFHARIDPN